MCTLLRAGILITFGMLIIGIIGGCGDDDPPEEVTDPPQSEDDVGPASATEVVVDPPPTGVPTLAIFRFIYPETEFTLRFNEGVVRVRVNDTPASGSGLNWKWRADPYLPYGSISLNIKWTNHDGSVGSMTVGPYNVAINGGEPPVITSSTVSDGSNDVDPAAVNANGIEIVFDEDVTGTIKLTDEAGADLNWKAAVSGNKAMLTVIAGQELVNGTTYKVELDIMDGAGNKLALRTITFVTKPK